MKRFLLALLLLVLALPLCAQEYTPTPEEIAAFETQPVKPEICFIQPGARIWTEFNMSNYELGGNSYRSPREVIAHAVGEIYKPSTSKIIDDSESFYEVSMLGYSFYVRASDVNIDQKAKKKLNLLRHSSAELQNSYRMEAQTLSIIGFKISKAQCERIMSQHKASPVMIGTLELAPSSGYGIGNTVRVNFLNISKKTIKYLYITLAGCNPVDDVVKQVKVKGIGPIRSMEASTYVFDDLDLKDRTITQVKIKSLTVQFMDGSKKIVQNPERYTLSMQEQTWFAMYSFNGTFLQILEQDNAE